MAVENWTEASVLKLRAPADKADFIINHPRVEGLQVRIRNGGTGTYRFYFWNGVKDRAVTIAKVGAVTLKFAEDEARRMRGDLVGADKVDPLIAKAKAVSEKAAPLVGLIDEFLESQRDKGRSADYVARQSQQLKVYFAGLHTIPIKLIAKSDVIRELNAIKRERGKISMTNSRATLSKFFNWAGAQDYCDHNPVTMTEKVISTPRDVVLSPKELAIIWREAGDDEHGRIVRLLMLTGARRTQIGGMRKRELNRDEALVTFGGQIGIREAKRLAKLGEIEDASLSKNRKTFLLPLSRQAVELLDQQGERRDSRYMFGNGAGGFSGWSKAMAALKARIAEKHGDAVRPDWGFHDFRRSFDTLGQDKVKLDHGVVDACINHIPEAKKGTRKHYNFAMLLDERIDAFQRWADYIEGLVKDVPHKPDLRLVA